MQAFRFNSSGWLTGSLHFIIVAIAAQADTPAAWPYALAAMAGVSFCAWVANYRRYRTIHDLPTSKIASAAQGYVELFGRSELLPGAPVHSKLSSTRCCWYRYYLEHKTSDDKWEHEDSGTSTEHFVVIDDSGQCVVSPEGAEVLCAEKKTWTEGSYRYTEWLLLPQGTLYAIGDFVTLGGAQADVDERRDISELLREWKAQPAQLLARFDLDGDGQLDLKEWELARLQARREVAKAHSEIRSRGGVHMLRQPGDGRLFLLACEVPDKIGRRYAWWSAVHLAVFFAAGTVAFVLFSTGAAS
jgi:hypothetical protein